MSSRPVLLRLGLVLITILVLAGLYMCFWAPGEQALVVYCAHDAVYSEAVLKAFEKETGIPLVIKFDTEATKSLGLIELLMREKDNPQCDVFWNNELLGTLALKQAGVLAAYKGPGYVRIPEGFRDPDGMWAGFSARLRVLIFNTDKGAVTQDAAAQLLQKQPGLFALAKPLYGTTLTHFTILWKQWGSAGLKDWFMRQREAGMQVVNGNGAVKTAVAEGACAAGYTDTDDFYAAADDGRPVDLLPVELESGQTICIPNTAAIIKNCRHPESAQKLIDYLLSAQTEIRLAQARSRQIPLGAVDDALVPAEVRQLRVWAAKGYPLHQLEDVYADCRDWLKAEYSQ